METQHARLGPPVCPILIKILILVTLGVSLGSVLITSLSGFLGYPLDVQGWLSLNPQFWTHYYLWQPLSYLFVHPAAKAFTLDFFLALIFNLFMLWVIGSQVYEEIGKKSFLRFYFACGFASGFLLCLVMLFSGIGAFVAGPSACIFALLSLWTVLNPELEVLLFLTFPMKAKWLIAGTLGIFALVALTNFAFYQLLLYGCGFLAGYIYGIGGLERSSPYEWAKPLDPIIQGCWPGIPPSQDSRGNIDPPYGNSKIFDFKTGKAVLDDEAFMDAMLQKISEKGEDSLTRKERKRMKQISSKKNY